MFLQATSPLIFLCCLYVAVQCKLTPEETIKAEIDCIEETEVAYDVVQDVMETAEVPDDPNYKQFLTCFWKKQGIIDSQGEIQFEELKSLVALKEDGTPRPHPEKILASCKKIAAKDPLDLPVLVLRCIFHNLIESQKQG